MKGRIVEGARRGAAGAALAVLILSGCGAHPAIDTRYRAASQDSRVQFIVLHYTELDFA